MGYNKYSLETNKSKEFQSLLKMNEEASVSKENLVIRLKHDNDNLKSKITQLEKELA